jgi:hypothetical protein
MLLPLAALSKEKKKPQNPILEALERQKSPPKPKEPEKPKESLVKGLPNYDKAKNLETAKAQQAAMRKKAEVESKIVKKRAIYTAFGWAEAEITGAMTPAKLQAARDEIEADQISQGKKPVRKLERVEKDLDTDYASEMGKRYQDAGNALATKVGFGEDSPLNSEPVRKVAKTASVFAKAMEASQGRDIGSINPKTGKKYEGFLNETVDTALHPASSILGDIEKATDKNAQPMERAGSAVNVALTTTGYGQLPGQIAKGAIKAGVKSLESPLAKSLGKQELHSPLAKSLQDLPITAKVGAQGEVRMADGSVKFMPSEKSVPTIKQPEPVKTTTTQKPPTTVKTPQNSTSSNVGSTETTTSARKAQLAGDRESLGLPELDDAVHKSFGESLSNAHKKGYTKPKWVKAETEKILKKPRALSDEETAGFTNHLSTIKHEHSELFKTLKNIDDPESIANVRSQLDAMESDFDQITEAVKRSGTEKGRALVSQKLTLNDVNDIISVKNAQKLAKGEKLTVKENLEAERIGKELEEANLKIKDLEDKNTAFSQMVDNLKAKTPGKSGERILRTATRQVRRTKAVDNIKKKWAGYKSETDGAATATIPGGKQVADIAGKLASIAPDVKELIKTYIEEGVEKLSDIMPKIRKDTGLDDLTEDHINLILSDDYPKAKRTYSESELDREYNKAILADLKKQAKRSEPAQKARLEKSIASFEKKIANEKLPPGKPDLPTSKEIEDLIIRRESAKIQHEDLVRNLKEKRSFKENPGLHIFDEITNIPKALVLSGDISAPLTHGAFMAFTHPIMWARATGHSIKAFASVNARTATLAKIRANPYFDKAVASKVAGISSRDLTEPNFGGLLSKIPVAGKLFRASDRAFETYSASARMQLFEHMAKAQEGSWMNRFTKPPTRDTYNAIGEAVNTMTGKGTGEVANALTSGAIKIGEHKLPIASKVLIAPGYMVSRWKLALGSPALNAAIRREPMLAARILKDYAKLGSVAYAGLKLAEAHGMEVDFDPKSNNFMKMKLPNSKVYIDPFGGIFAPYKTIAQLMPGSKKDPAITAGFYATGKAAPPVRAYMNYKAGEEKKKQFGKSYDLSTPEGKKNSLLQFLPLSVQNGKEIMEEQGLTSDQRAALLIAAFFGTNVNVKEGADKK